MKFLVRSIFKCLAWLAGRSFSEMKDDNESQYKNSIVVGGLFVITAMVVTFGHFLWWSHLPMTTSSPVLPTVISVILVLSAYRGAMACLDVAGRWSLVLFLILGTIAGTNTIFAGEEVLIYIFEAQIEEQISEDAYNKQNDFATLALHSAQSQKSDILALNTQIAEVQASLESTTPLIAQLSSELLACNQQTNALKATATPIGFNGYARDQRALNKQTSMCASLTKQRNKLLAESVAEKKLTLNHLNAQLNDSFETQKQLVTKAHAASEANNSIIYTSVSVGMARHKALWSAVWSGKVPITLAVFLMATLCMIELLTFIAKILMGKDTIGIRNMQEKLFKENEDLLYKAISNSYRQAIKADAKDASGKIITISKQQYEWNVKPLVDAHYNSNRVHAMSASYDAAAKASSKYGKSFLDAFATIPESNGEKTTSTV